MELALSFPTPKKNRLTGPIEDSDSELDLEAKFGDDYTIVPPVSVNEILYFD